MDRQKFITDLESASECIDMEYVNKVVIESLSPASSDKFEGFTNLIIATEELAECQQQLTKFLRGKSDHIALLEELSDALLSIIYAQKICGITEEELRKALNVKLNRQAKRNNIEFCKEA